MGIPAAFRWLSNKYAKIISPVIEDHPLVMDDGTTIPVDITRPNPNGEEFDNLYLDFNGIVHPCSHPEDKPAPKDEEEMMTEIFKYTERVFNMVRPRKVLMIAVDGVAPRAKMNQQRSRRFRAAQEAEEKEADKQELLKLMSRQNGAKDVALATTEEVTKKAFDSNSITPGTPFMDILAKSLRYWCAYKLNTDPAWAKIKVIISDATVPGEGEHKIMNFVRSQRASPEYDPNTRHVIYGLDADLIMLGLATHEAHFRVLREDVFFQEGKSRICKLCGQSGHYADQCRGEAKEKAAAEQEKEEAEDKPLIQKPFIWLHVSVLREYLAVELEVPNLPFRFDIERAIDDWIFLCCFVGNDFLPHLPALEIREHGIDALNAIWRDNLPYMGGYVTKDGHVDLERAQLIMAGLAKQEDAIFRRRKEMEDRRENNAKRRKREEESRSRERNGGAISEPPQAITHDMVVNRASVQDANVANKSAASVLKSQLQGKMNQVAKAPSSDAKLEPNPASSLGKRKAAELDDSASNGAKPHGLGTGTPSGSGELEVVDTVRLWEDGYADRYYEQKFNVNPKDIEFRHKVARAYVEGLAWVLLYYFQGCPSWEWFYPYHYAPFAADFVDLGKMRLSFEKGRISRPYEQLMSVLPAASRHAIPKVFHPLMTEEDSPIIDFYPKDFALDLNGKKFAWQGVVLLPFIEMPRLLAAMDTKYPLLSEEEAARNTAHQDVLLLSEGHTELYDEISGHFYSKKQGAPKYKLNPRVSGGLSGKVEKMEEYLPHGALMYPMTQGLMPDLEYDRSVAVHYEMPQSGHVHKSMLLPGVKMSTPALTRSDVEEIRGKSKRSGRSHGGAPLHRNGSGHGGRRNQIDFGPGQSYTPRDSRPDYGRGPPSNGYRDQPYSNGYHQPPPQAWQPPPPGMAGFGVGMPPPPPPAYYQGNNGYAPPSRPAHGNGHAHQYNNGQYRPPGEGSQYPPNNRGQQWR